MVSERTDHVEVVTGEVNAQVKAGIGNAAPPTAETETCEIGSGDAIDALAKKIRHESGQ
jgi:hypothetical protein